MIVDFGLWITDSTQIKFSRMSFQSPMRNPSVPNGSRRTRQVRPGALCTGIFSFSTTPKPAFRPSTGWRGSTTAALPQPPRSGPCPGKRKRAPGLALCGGGSLDRELQRTNRRKPALTFPSGSLPGTWRSRKIATASAWRTAGAGWRIWPRCGMNCRAGIRAVPTSDDRRPSPEPSCSPGTKGVLRRTAGSDIGFMLSPTAPQGRSCGSLSKTRPDSLGMKLQRSPAAGSTWTP